MLRSLLAFAASLLSTAAWGATATQNIAITIQAAASGAEEFVGPLAGWQSVKAAPCNASGTGGASNDTSAIQTCLNLLNTSSASGTSVLWFPAGTYNINAQLNIPQNAFGVQLIGQDPTTTIIKWTGNSTPHAMLYVDGMDYSKVSRLTFDGSSLINTIIDSHSSNATSNYATHDEWSDLVLTNATGNGYTAGVGDAANHTAEQAFLRDTFDHVVNGISLAGFNTLDIWAWYSTFSNNTFGLTNNVASGGAGNFHAFANNFLNNSAADANNGNAGVFTYNFNYSSGSGSAISAGGGSNPVLWTAIGNTILDTVNSPSILIDSLGPAVVTDNVIRSLASASTPVIQTTCCSTAKGDMLSMGNTVTLALPAAITAKGRLYEVGDTSVSRTTICATSCQPTLPPVPPNNGRSIQEVSAGASAATINAAITAAIAAGSRSVVHLPAGNYNIGSTITVPASDIQIIGDGRNTAVTWTGAANGTIIQLTGPSKVVLRDMYLNGNNKSATGIAVTNADQAGSRVFIEGGDYITDNTALLVNQLDNTIVEMHDSTPHEASTDAVNVVGHGSRITGVTNLFGNAGDGDQNTFRTSSDGVLNVEFFWHDNGGIITSSSLSQATGNGSLSLLGIAGFMKTAGNMHTLTNFTGTSAFLNVDNRESSGTNTISFTGSGAGANDLVFGFVGLAGEPLTDTSGDTSGFLGGQTTQSPTGGDVTAPLTDQGSSASAFLTASMAKIRAARPSPPVSTASGVTDVQIFKVNAESCINGISLSR